LNTTWDRPHIKHVIMAYGIDMPTEVAFTYRKDEYVEEGDDNTIDTTPTLDEGSDKVDYDDMPTLDYVIWEEAGGTLIKETRAPPSSRVSALNFQKKNRKETFNTTLTNKLHHSGDGTIPYLSLSWAHTWLLHATRAKRHDNDEDDDNDENNTGILSSIQVSHRPKGGSEWISGIESSSTLPPSQPQELAVEVQEEQEKGDDNWGTSHPHGTKYKPEMVRFRSEGRSRNTGMEYTTTVIEAIGVEHKETTRNYDILAAAFTEILRNMHNDFGFV